MQIVRSPAPFLKNFVYVTEFQLRQLWIIRFLCGGIWFKTNGAWDQCYVILEFTDGTRILKCEDISFHETNALIEDLEDYT
jgi:hypothetical protein